MGTITSIGFTGTQRVLAAAQACTLQAVLNRLHMHDIYAYHHGTCIGADEQFDAMIRLIDNPGSTIHIHPPLNQNKVAACCDRPAGARQMLVHIKKDYLDRNADIVSKSHILIACPNTKHEVMRSGTWATIRCAKRQGVPFVVVFPDGSLRFSWQK